MRDPYLYPDSSVLANKLGIRTQEVLEDAEADYVVLRLRELAETPLPGKYNYKHLMEMHHYIFQDIYEWAGEERRINIYKEEEVLGGLSIDYSDVYEIKTDSISALSKLNSMKLDLDDPGSEKNAEQIADALAWLWKIHPFREGNTRTTVTFVCQYIEEKGLHIDRNLFEANGRYVRTAMVAYNAVFKDLGDRSQKQYLINFIKDALT